MKTLLILLILLINFQNSFSQSISPDSLVLHLPFTGSAKDVSGNNYDGVIKGATLTTGGDNLPNTAYYFDGTSSIVIPDLKRLDRPLQAFTILIKLQVSNLDIDSVVQYPFTTAYNFLYWHRNIPDSEQAFLYSKIRTSWQPAWKDSSINPLLAFNTDWCNISNISNGYNRAEAEVFKWHTIAYVYSNTSIRVYHNCEISKDYNGIPSTVSVLCGTEPVQITLGSVPGDVFKYGYRYFKGKIDDLQVYTRALSKEEIATYANSLCAEKPVVDLLINRDTCKSSSINFSDVSDMKGMPRIKRQWEINNIITDTTKSFRYDFPAKGNYHVKLSVFTDSFTRYSSDTLITVDSINYLKFLFPADTSALVCKGSSISYNVNTDAALTWMPCTYLNICNSAQVEILPASHITYTISAINTNGCRDTARFKIHVLDTVDKVYTPTAFTPNGDRLNDSFGPLSHTPLKEIDLNIYNRWGSTVFTSKKQTHKWDGTFKGIPQPAGVYIYTLAYQQGNGCEPKQEKGTFQMIR